MKPASTPARLVMILVAAALVSACATFGVRLESFNERLAGGYASVTFARETAGALLEAGFLSADEAEQVQRQADNLRAGLDIAADLKNRDEPAANDKLELTLAALAALADYLRGLER